MIGKAGLTMRNAIRQKGTSYAELGLDNPALSDDALLDAMLAHPILINRPFEQNSMFEKTKAVGAQRCSRLSN